ncbi:MAG: DUF4115 domain-containing protein, partial [Candidatus Omnitrophica bacterium]|nr:DUF4115 domain-containing protein [Candidatus Omnitrophota bacterium]
MEPTKGTRLKKLRLEKGISLEEIQKKTKIHPNILRAIEGDAITDLSPIYLKSFLKIYCKFLGVDSRHYLGDYKETRGLEGASAEPLVKEFPQRIQESRSFLKDARLRMRSLRPNKKISRVIIIVLAGAFLLMGLIKAGKAIFSKRGSSVPRPAAGTVTARPKAKAAVKKTRPVNDISSEIRLGIRAKDNCWITLKVDGRIVFQRVLTKGRFESWKAKNKIELSLGNAGAVELEVNGQLFANLGRKGQALKNIV